jgi:hypothetical protein
MRGNPFIHGAIFPTWSLGLRLARPVKAAVSISSTPLIVNLFFVIGVEIAVRS